MKRHLAGFAATLVAAVVAASGAAAQRPDTRAMSCDQVRSLIDRSGAIVLTTGQHTYDRFVGLRYRCDYPYVPTRTTVQTRDANQCAVYNCQRRLYDYPFSD